MFYCTSDLVFIKTALIAGKRYYLNTSPCAAPCLLKHRTWTSIQIEELKPSKFNLWYIFRISRTTLTVCQNQI